MLFVHGFNNTIDIAAQRMALLLRATNPDGIPVIFSWPSAAKSGLTSNRGRIRSAYRVDQSRALESCNEAQEILSLLAQSFGPENLIVLGHSMGTHILDMALRNCSEEGDLLAGQKLRALVYAAPDISQTDFDARRDWASRLSDAFNIYISRQDVALMISNGVNSGRRLGQGGGGRFQDPRFTVVDAMQLEERGGFNHAYVFTVEEAMFDLRLVLSGLTDPNDRGCLRREVDPYFMLMEFGDFDGCATAR